MRGRAVCLLVAVIAAACGTTSTHPATPTPAARRTPTPVATPPATPAPAPPAPPLQPPVIVQVENSIFARPQSGISFAPQVYEYVTEGGISRFSVMFTTIPSVLIGPTRSARLATVQLLQLYGGVLAYSGSDQYVAARLAATGLPFFNEGSAGGDLFRYGTRPAPHNLYTDGAHLSDLVSRAHPSPRTYDWYASRGTTEPGVPATHFTVPISTSETPGWTWSAAQGGWLRAEADTGPFIDADTSRQVLATTVIVQQVPIAVSPFVVDVNGVHGVNHTLTGSGPAQVFVDGTEWDATWAQPPGGPPTLTLANGQLAPIAPGLIWFELVATGSPARIG